MSAADVRQDAETAIGLVTSLIQILDRMDQPLYHAEYNAPEGDKFGDAAWRARKDIAEAVLCNNNLEALKSALTELKQGAS
ncbi:hypothetical protein MYRNA_12 [Mycobacterium phage Myrna]|uniref:Uncharacterized protein n=1 Tax=Mycobacterium phage Myrna TaxID=546805 RepID=B5LJ23_9CAUD|nr:gp12 [Mycobacterium phage Myrna]ACH62020.1 hypothetical protein MYRNA_12 [Mycobacterium phage Myrna]